VIEAAFGGARERVTADEREARRQRPRRRDDVPLRAAGVGDDRRHAHVIVEVFQQRDVLFDRRRQHHEIRFSEHHEFVRRDVDRVQPHRRLEHFFVVDRNHERRGPKLPGRESNRAADEAKPHDPDLLKDRGLALARPSRLYDGELHIAIGELVTW